MSNFYDDASLVMIPAGYKAGTAYSQKPTDGSGDLTFTRASHATRVNVNGYVEKARTNSLLQSNQFDTTWTTNALSVTSGQADKDGGTEAWKLQSTAASTCWVTQSVSLSGVQTFSIYAKGGNVDWIRINALVGGTNANNYYDITNGAKGASPSASVIADSVTSAGNGFYRVDITYNDTVSSIRVQIAEADGDENVPSGSNVYIQDTQLEQGLVATDYIETTTAAVTAGIYNDVPRLNYPAANGCPSLLLEPQRTNLITNSEYFDGTDWFEGNTTVTTNAAVSPENFTNASQVDFAAVANANLQRSAPTSVTLGLDYTCTFWARASAPVNNVKLSMDGVDTDLAITTTWTRFTRTVTAAGTTLATTLVTRDSVAVSIELWGFQLEQGSYATSYIPTYGSTVTRSADSSSKTGIASLFGATDGVVFLEVGEVHNNSATGAGKWFFEVRKDATNSFGIASGGADDNPTLRFVTQIAGALVTEASPAGFKNSKIAFKYSATEFKLFHNGSLIITVAKNIGNYAEVEFMEGASDDLSMILDNFLVIDEVYTDAQCITLTTL